jgi:hypothetical protein
MPKMLTIAGLAVAALLGFMFGLDLAVGVPFSRVAPTMDILFLVCAAMLGYMSWSTYREQT